MWAPPQLPLRQEAADPCDQVLPLTPDVCSSRADVGMGECLCLGRVLQVSGGPQGRHREPGGYSLPVFRGMGMKTWHTAGETQWMHQRWSLVFPAGSNSLWTEGKVQMKGCNIERESGISATCQRCGTRQIPPALLLLCIFLPLPSYEHSTMVHGSKSSRSCSFYR